MNNHKISCIYYPTTTLLVDDQCDFLEQLQLKLGDRLPTILYSDPTKALKYLQQEVKRNDTIKRVIEIDEKSEYYSHQSTGQLPVKYNISNLYKQAYNQNHFSEISVLVVDYDMPMITGAQLCAALKGSAIKIIMLTGQGDEQMAVRLFNEGLIDKFITKRQKNLDEQLKMDILDMQNRYFQDLTDPIVKGLIANEDSALGDPAFIDLFTQTYQALSASSYYLIDVSGSFLFLDDQGSATWLLIKAHHEVEELMAQVIDPSLGSLPKKDSEGRMELPYFLNFDDYFNLEKLNHPQYWHNTQVLKGNREYYYAVVKDVPGFSLDRSKIFSFDDYRQQYSY